LIDILNGCKKALPDSQKKLYYLLYNDAMRISMRYTRHPEEAAEMINNGFLEIFRRIPRFEYPADHHYIEWSFRSWFNKIMAHAAVDYLRKNRNDLLNGSIKDIEGSGQETAAFEIHPLDHIAYGELIGYIHTLSPAYRIVFNLFVIDGFSHEEISGMLGISAGTSKSNLFRAREQLRKMLKKTNEETIAKYN
jgi:RNA polymerase sigma-70 factor (ECF subfamily)